jgi:3-oxoacyl-[acyl-carrier protein] reductase
MLLENKNARINGAGGAIGGGVARAFAREVVHGSLADHTLATRHAVANAISAARGMAEKTRVNALGAQTVAEHTGAV